MIFNLNCFNNLFLFRFYVCIFGRRHKRECPATLEFNTKTNQCDLKENANCVSSNTNNGTATTPSDPSAVTTKKPAAPTTPPPV